MKKDATKIAASKGVTSKAASSWYKKIKADANERLVRKAKISPPAKRTSKGSYFKRLATQRRAKTTIPPAAMKLLPKSTRIKYQRKLVAENRARVTRAKVYRQKKMKAESKKARIKRLPKAQAIPGPRGRAGRTGQEGQRGARGFPGYRGQRGQRGPRGQSVSTTVRWRHKLEKDRLNRALLNQQRLGRERAELQRAHVTELSKRNAILLQRISEQEHITAKKADEKTMYKQWKTLKDNAETTIFPTLGGIDIEDEQLATGMSVLPWAIIAIALISREG
jgi:hypothetical protein